MEQQGKAARLLAGRILCLSRHSGWRDKATLSRHWEWRDQSDLPHHQVRKCSAYWAWAHNGATAGICRASGVGATSLLCLHNDCVHWCLHNDCFGTDLLAPVVSPYLGFRVYKIHFNEFVKLISICRKI